MPLASKSLNSELCYNKVFNFTEKVLFCSTYHCNKLDNGTSFKFKDILHERRFSFYLIKMSSPSRVKDSCFWSVLSVLVRLCRSSRENRIISFCGSQLNLARSCLLYRGKAPLWALEW